MSKRSKSPKEKSNGAEKLTFVLEDGKDDSKQKHSLLTRVLCILPSIALGLTILPLLLLITILEITKLRDHFCTIPLYILVTILCRRNIGTTLVHLISWALLIASEISLQSTRGSQKTARRCVSTVFRKSGSILSSTIWARPDIRIRIGFQVLI